MLLMSNITVTKVTIVKVVKNVVSVVSVISVNMGVKSVVEISSFRDELQVL